MTLATRVIPCLDVDEGRVVKGVRFEGLRDMGDPAELAARYARDGADEIVFLDVTATAKGRVATLDVVSRTAETVFVPLTVGGGVRSEADVRALLRAGADRVVLNTAAVADPRLLARCAARFGSQCVVVAIDARRRGSGWEVMVDAGKTPTRLGAVQWARTAEREGAGEIVLTSIDRDGTGEGYDVDLLRAVTAAVGVPVVASGGAGTLDHFVRAVVDGGADAVLAASRWHAGRFTIDDVKAALACAGVTVRRTTSGASAAGVATDGASLDLRFDDRGLIPAVMQDATSGEVLMVAWMNREALGRTLADGRTWFWSRSREELWAKGETSGHVQRVVEVRADCDGDTLLVRVEQTGVACHTGTRSCFSRTIEEDRC
jgi:imidazoleglycerol phosphate synthase cyclase subunit